VGPTSVYCVAEVCRPGLEPLCSGISCFGTHRAHNFLNNRCSVPISCNKEREICGKWLLSSVIVKLSSVHSEISWNKSLHLQQLQRYYCENAGSTVSACAMLQHCSITYVQSLRAIYGLLAVGRVGNLLCGRATYYWHTFLILKQLKLAKIISMLPVYIPN
jgi:hypothetical protein